MASLANGSREGCRCGGQQRISAVGAGDDVYLGRSRDGNDTLSVLEERAWSHGFSTRILLSRIDLLTPCLVGKVM